jgi:hypothetical protein
MGDMIFTRSSGKIPKTSSSWFKKVEASKMHCPGVKLSYKFSMVSNQECPQGLQCQFQGGLWKVISANTEKTKVEENLPIKLWELALLVSDNLGRYSSFVHCMIALSVLLSRPNPAIQRPLGTTMISLLAIFLHFCDCTSVAVTCGRGAVSSGPAWSMLASLGTRKTKCGIFSIEFLPSLVFRWILWDFWEMSLWNSCLYLSPSQRGQVQHVLENFGKVRHL